MIERIKYCPKCGNILTWDSGLWRCYFARCGFTASMQSMSTWVEINPPITGQAPFANPEDET